MTAMIEFGRSNGMSARVWVDRAMIAVSLALVALAGVPRLPAGICYGDNGDLQLASVTLGIMHPPGYPAFTTLGYLITRLPGFNPAYWITLACFASGLLGLWLAIMLQLRLGVHAAVACITALIFATHERFWTNVLAPEVYMPSMAMLGAAVYQLVKYRGTARSGHLMLSAAFLGVAMANRPPMAMTVPFFVVAWWLIQKRQNIETSKCQKEEGKLRSVETSENRDKDFRDVASNCFRPLGLAAGCALLPILYTLGYLWFRDTPTTAYNYIEQHNVSHELLPSVEEGWRAKARRVLWQVTGEQFHGEFGYTLRGVRSKLRWLRDDLLFGRPITLAAAALIVAAGAVRAFRRSPAAGWLLAGLAAHSIVFVLVYRVYGQAADLLPLLFAATVFAGMGISIVVHRFTAHGAAITLNGRFPARREIGLWAVAAVIVAAVASGAEVSRRWSTGRNVDARTFLEQVDLPTFPENAIICAEWTPAVPLWYAQQILTPRPDIYIVAGEYRQWDRLLRDNPDRPMFIIESEWRFEGYRLEPYRNMWRIVPEAAMTPMRGGTSPDGGKE